jgi:hypothetical protein
MLDSEAVFSQRICSVEAIMSTSFTAADTFLGDVDAHCDGFGSEEGLTFCLPKQR